MINPSHWKVSLPIYKPGPVMDKSVEEDHLNCPRLGFYKHGLRRGFPGINYPIQYGNAYHKYRDTLEKLILASGIKDASVPTLEMHNEAFTAAIKDYKNPPENHYYGYLTLGRVVAACAMAFKRVLEERRTGRITVTQSEQPVDLEMDWWICTNCSWTEVIPKDTPHDYHQVCVVCGEDYIRGRHGGVIDQFIIFNSLNDARMIRDFKTTGRMGATYNNKWDPNSQIQGYVWDGSRLSGREFDGAMIETVYNTKKVGPEIHQFYVEYTKGQQEQWEASRMIERQFIMTMYNRVEELGYLAFPQRTNHCPAYGGCAFKDPCKSSSAYEIEKWLDDHTEEHHWDFFSAHSEEGE
jgi:hypothetical protein